MKLLSLKTIKISLLLIFFTTSLIAQTTTKAKITGVLKDAITQETIPFATAVLINKTTKANVKVAQTDINGAFVMANLPAGVFTFKISFVGYQTMVRDNVTINTTTATLNFGDIKMNAAKGNVLSEVTVTGQKAAMQLGIDKKVFSVDQSLVSEGGSATDLLANVPSVQTDLDGNVSLRGSSGVKVLIDGKPSLIAGGNVAQILQSIPASSIESVEVITNPSSKYDAEGQSGIINIILKRNTKLGFNGSVALTAGNRDNYNGNTNLSFQNSKINIYGNYGYRNGNRIGGGHQDINYLKPFGSVAFTNQNTDSKGTDKGHNVKAGIDYYITEKSIISLSGSFNSRDNLRNEFIGINQFNSANSPVSLSNRNNSTDGTGTSFDLNLDFTQKFKKPKEELTFNFGFAKGSNDNFQIYSTNVYNKNGAAFISPEGIQHVNNLGNNKNYNVQVDYTLPVGKAGKFETGYRSQIKLGDNTQSADSLLTNIFVTNYQLNNYFDNKDQVHALYVNYQNQVKDFGYQIGLRGEDARLDTYLEGYKGTDLYSAPGKIHYTRLYPSVFLTQKFKGDQQIQASYTRRVNRPRAWDTNPFLDVSDPYNHRAGNPNLLPEDVHSFELGYSKYWKKVTFTSTAYFRQTNDVVQRVRSEADENGVILTTPQNLSKQINSGLELIGRFDVVKSLNFTTNVNLYQSKIFGDDRYGIKSSNGFTWNANVTANLSVIKNFSIQMRGDYRAPEVMAQGKRNVMYGFDGGAKYDFPNKKASLSLNVRDIFGTRKWSMTTTQQTTVVDFERRMQGTMANLTFSYRFGKSTFKLNKTKKTDQQQDNRPDEGSF
jgi:outer membrane receptor protein involved in Fe transport